MKKTNYVVNEVGIRWPNRKVIIIYLPISIYHSSAGNSGIITSDASPGAATRRGSVVPTSNC